MRRRRDARPQRRAKRASPRARVAAPGGFGTLVQVVRADDYRGRRVRFAGWVMTEHVTGGAGVWLRVDRSNGAVLAIDNLRVRAVQGTTAWTRREVVLDVAVEAATISFGLLLDGGGTAWLADVALDVVGLDTPTTGAPVRQLTSAPALPRPRNLDFLE